MAERLAFRHHQHLRLVCAIDLAAHQAAATMMRQRRTDVSNRVPRCCAQPEIPVLDVNLAALVESPNFFEHSPRHHHRQCVDEEIRVIERAKCRPGRTVGSASVTRTVDDRGVKQSRLGIPVEILNLSRELFRQPLVIGVEECHEFAG